MRLTITVCLALVAGVATASGLASSCGDEESECERLCPSLREKLINNFAIDPEAIDCEDPKWRGSCAQCERILLQDFDVTAHLCR